MPYPSGASDTDVNAAVAIVQAALNRANLGIGNANPGLISTINQALGALNDMAATSNPRLYSAAQWAAFAAAMQTLASMAASNNDGATALACNYAASIFTSL